MAAKAVASALHILTSKEFLGCTGEWADDDNNRALMSEFFTGTCDDTSDESDNGKKPSIIPPTKMHGLLHNRQ